MEPNDIQYARTKRKMLGEASKITDRVELMRQLGYPLAALPDGFNTAIRHYGDHFGSAIDLAAECETYVFFTVDLISRFGEPWRTEGDPPTVYGRYSCHEGNPPKATVAWLTPPIDLYLRHLALWKQPDLPDLGAVLAFAMEVLVLKGFKVVACHPGGPDDPEDTRLRITLANNAQQWVEVMYDQRGLMNDWAKVRAAMEES